jgi:ketosteroid isomerase-like protein
MKISKIFTLVAFLIFLSSCNLSFRDPDKDSQVLIERDIEFSNYSQEYGIKKAFIEFADSAAVLLKPNQMPIKGDLSIRIYYKMLDDSQLNLSWVPLEAKIAGSRDLGYTYGIWELKTSDTIENGTYVTIWKKDKEGAWKYVLDSGTEGLKLMRDTD